jgi:hypothetical protein
MTYSVKLDKGVREKLTSWRLPREAIRALLQRFDELSQHPTRHPLRIRSPADTLESDVVVHEPGAPARDWMIVLSVRYGTDEETLYIVDCDRLVIERD